ncbi:histidine phosphatase family protein [Ramlibacter humi]|uniref:histidine phosphatase family protein n=1 Tax=Ramlibacter humi TaxID=2530451 RepID=UPI00142F9DEA|nr:histidine phosphatase family protein [Ramlibacter humi]
MKLWLVRHARTTAREGLCYGRTDVVADPAQTQEAAARLHSQLPPSVRVRCSPASRCRVLADAMARHRPGLAITIDPALREMDFGTWENRLWDDIGEAAMSQWTADFAGHRPGGGENVREMLARVSQALNEERALGEAAVWVTHAGVIRAARLCLAGATEIRSAMDWPSTPAPFGAGEPHEVF